MFKTRSNFSITSSTCYPGFAAMDSTDMQQRLDPFFFLLLGFLIIICKGTEMTKSPCVFSSEADLLSFTPTKEWPNHLLFLVLRLTKYHSHQHKNDHINFSSWFWGFYLLENNCRGMTKTFLLRSEGRLLLYRKKQIWPNHLIFLVS